MVTSDAAGDTSAISPRDEYERRLRRREAEIAAHERRENFAGQARVASFSTIIAAAVFFRTGGLALPIGLTAAAVAFVAAIAWHRRVVSGLRRARIAARYYATAIERLDGRWAGRGPDGAGYRRNDHLFANDLDLFGRGSMYQLLCAARTPMGQDTLARWLLTPADTATIPLRQAAIEELRGAIDLREAMAVIETPSQKDFQSEALRRWAEAPSVLTDRWPPILAAVLAILATVALLRWMIFGVGGLWLLAIALAEGVFLLVMKRKIREVTQHIESALGNLNLLVEVLRVLETQRFKGSLLRGVMDRLDIVGKPPSRRIARLARLVGYWETMRLNAFVIPFSLLWMLPLHLAYAVERWRRVHGKHVAGWLQAVGEFESLSSLATFAFEHPAFPFPEIPDEGPTFDAQAIGHPLIPADRRVTNDVALDEQRQMLLVSGSNMSGKSTLLRTVGLNAALALAGAPVCAGRLRMSPLAIASSMRNVDSLQDGVSAFYAEIQRLRSICDLAAGSMPVLFLLDEILHGTNSHDRRIGAEVVIDSLLKRRAVGLITTHDLALAEIADRPGAAAANVHFEDQLIDGRLHFDYRLRPGVVPKGNGLVLMRLLGFDV